MIVSKSQLTRDQKNHLHFVVDASDLHLEPGVFPAEVVLADEHHPELLSSKQALYYGTGEDREFAGMKYFGPISTLTIFND